MKIRGTIITKDAIEQDGVIEVENGIITAVYPASKNNGFIDHDFYGHYVGPGFIDLHIHGAMGKGFDCCGAKEYTSILEYCAAHGTTSLLAGIVPSKNEVTKKAVANAKRNILRNKENKKASAKILGVHLEGPFVNPLMPGAMDVNNITQPSIDLYRQWEEAEVIKMITLAPEVEGARELIKYITSNSSVIVSAGHSKSSFDRLNESVGWGVTHLTHFYNAMTGLNHREPGCAGAGLFNPAITIEIIPDFIHVHRKMVELALRIKGADGICLITDSVDLAGMPDGVYENAKDYKRIVSDSKVSTEDGTLAGSSLTMDKAVCNMVKCGATVTEAWRMASYNPAKKLGLEHKLGNISPGASADLTILDKNLRCIATIIDGDMVRSNMA